MLEEFQESPTTSSLAEEKIRAFIAEYYPNFCTSHEIMYLRDLWKLMNGEVEKDSAAEELLRVIYKEDLNHPNLTLDFVRALTNALQLSTPYARLKQF